MPLRTAVVLIAAIAMTAGAAAAQQPPGLAFEVATIKPSTPSSPPLSIGSSPGRFAATNASLKMLVTWAYDLEGDDRLVGVQPWMDEARFDISAIVPARAAGESQAGERVKLMMQTLLAERFRLAVHPETRELPFYSLVVDRDGAKVTASTRPEDRGRNSFNMSGAGTLAGTKVTAAMLAKVLAGQLRQFVRDATGLEGVFDFTLEWTPETTAAAQATRPSIFTAVREQLGMRLDARRGPVEVVVIDRIDRAPTPD